MKKKPANRGRRKWGQRDRRKVENSNHLTKSGGEGPASGKGWAMGKSKQGGEKAWHTTSQAAGETEAQSRVTWPHLQAPEASRAQDFWDLPTPVSENPNSRPRAESELTHKCLAADPVVRSRSGPRLSGYLLPD